MKLFVIEGIDGAGKSTQMKRLGDHLVSKGYDCEYLHFPRTDAPFFGELIARFLRGEFGNLNEVDPYLVALLYAGDRKDASDKIRSWMNEGKIILLDRYVYSNVAYQGAKVDDLYQRKRLISWILSMEYNHFCIPKPDINIFLDVPLPFAQSKLASARRGSDRDYLNGSYDIHEENLSFQEKVRDVYLEVARSDPGMSVISCSDKEGKILPRETIFQHILEILKEKKLL